LKRVILRRWRFGRNRPGIDAFGLFDGYEQRQGFGVEIDRRRFIEVARHDALISAARFAIAVLRRYDASALSFSLPRRPWPA